MIQNFQNFVQKENLFQPTEKVLIAVSGGVDSIVLCHLFKVAKYDFGIAHCNFQLRGEESDGDANFVKNLAQEMAVEYFETSFSTTQFAKENQLSIQVAARDLRYAWLEKIRIANGFDFIATAHHLDDTLETVLYNFTKGCGIRGLHGIAPKINHIIRPLLFTHKKEVLGFAKNQNIKYREDASNASDKYARNNIRHHVIPILEQINPSVQKTTADNLQRIRETEQIFNYAIGLLKQDICETREDSIFIHIKKLQKTPAPATLLFEILDPFGFNNSQTRQMLESIDHQSGAIFQSPSHKVLLDRDFFILKKITPKGDAIFLIKKNETTVSFPQGTLNFKIKNQLPKVFPKEKKVAYFDLKKLTFPLTLRKWQAGDYFQPLGMNGQRKKIKSLLTDLKLSRFEKEEVWVLISSDEICWVVGIRMDERFKIEGSTTNSVEIVLS